MFILLPVGVDYRARRYPVVTFTLMGICTLVYIISLALHSSDGVFGEDWVFENLWLTPASSGWWAWITSMFVHAGIFHLVGNMIYLFLFGSCVEDMIGRFRFLMFYLLCGVVASFTHIALSEEHFASEIPLGGASGAISGCIGGFLLLLAKREIQFKYFFWFMFRIWAGDFAVRAWIVIAFWFSQDFIGMLLAQHSHGGGVAFAAHVGGTLFGLVLMSTRNVWLKRDSQEEDAPVPQPAVRPIARARARPPTAPAPVAETASIYLFLDGAQAGPFTSSQIQQMFALGSIGGDTLYWQEGMEDWRGAEELRQPGVG